MRAVAGYLLFITGLIGLGAAGITIFILMVFRTATDGWGNDLFLLLVCLLTVLWSLSTLAQGIRVLYSSINCEQQACSEKEKDFSSSQEG